MSADRRLDKDHTHNGILCNHKKNEILPLEIMGMDLGGTMLREISRTEKDKYCMISLICSIYKKKQMDT